MDDKVKQQKEHYDKSAHQPYEDLAPGKSVLYDHFSSKRKTPCRRKCIIHQKGDRPRSYSIITPYGQIRRRNRRHIKAEKDDSCSDSPLQHTVEESDSPVPTAESTILSEDSVHC